MSKDVIISFCISTYNRAEILDDTIKSIVSDTAFDDTVEIVIGDNGSTDSTLEVCERYAQLYRNLRYYRNEKNIAIYNFSKVLSCGNGLYLKFINDTQTFTPGTLATLKDKIINHKDDENNLIFINSGGCVKNNQNILCNDPSHLLDAITFYSTWSGNFGVYKRIFDLLEDKDRFTHLLIPQTDWLFRIVRDYPTRVISGKFFKTEVTSKKGSYSFFKTFSKDYLYLVGIHVDDRLAIEREKCRLFCKHLLPYYYNLKFGYYNYDYNLSGAETMLVRQFGLYPYFWFYTPIYFITHLLKRRR